MRKIRDVLRLHAEGMSKRKIAASLSIGATAAGDCVRRAKRADLSWPLPEQLSDEALERLLYPPPQVTAMDRRPRPDWPTIHRELRRPGVTLQLLWEEYRSVHPGGYGYSRYVELFRDWERRLSPTMRQVHVAGERMFVDYAGSKLQLVDETTGEVRACELFVAVLGASNYAYAEATYTQSLVDWIGSHERHSRHAAVASGQHESRGFGEPVARVDEAVSIHLDRALLDQAARSQSESRPKAALDAVFDLRCIKNWTPTGVPGPSIRVALAEVRGRARSQS